MKTVATETRDQAFREVKQDGTALTAKARVLECIRQHGPISDMEIARKLHNHVRGCGARRNELAADGLIRPVIDGFGKVLKETDPVSGKQVTLWVAVDPQYAIPRTPAPKKPKPRPVVPNAIKVDWAEKDNYFRQPVSRSRRAKQTSPDQMTMF